MSVSDRHSFYGKKNVKRLLQLISAMVLSGIGASMMIKAQLGVNAYDALTISISQTFLLPIGTVSMCMNLLFFILQILILRKDTEVERLLQIPLLLILGIAINFMTYEVLAGITVTSYFGNTCLFFTGLILSAASCSVLMKYNIGFPLESFCLVAAQKFAWRFSRIRQFLDIICIVLILIFYVLFSAPVNIREGTLLSMLLLGPLIEITLKKLNQ